MSIRNRAIFLACFAVALAGCGRGGLRSAGDDARAKTFVAAPGKSAIYLVRPDTVRKLALAVVLDDKLSARSLPCSYVVWQVDPGQHQLLAYGENVSQLTLTTEPDKTYFVRQDVAGGLWMPRTQLSLLDEASGRKIVDDCRLVAAK